MVVYVGPSGNGSVHGLSGERGFTIQEIQANPKLAAGHSVFRGLGLQS